jgi:lysozyme family protein
MSKTDNFEQIITNVLKNEGGYVNDPTDKGGETNFGISKRTYPDINIKNLTLNQAKTIYKRDFWDKQQYNNIDNINIAAKIFDLSVNIGVSKANILIQRALRSVGINVSRDGILGIVTLSAINKTSSTELLAALKSEAAGYYRSIVASNKKNSKFLKGWLKRAYA